MSKGFAERVHRVLHDSIAHYIDSSGTNWDFVVPFSLKAYRATPHSTTGYSPFYLVHGREMVLSNEGDLKAKVSPSIQDAEQIRRLENFKSSLRKAHKEVRIYKEKMHQKNKNYYDMKAKKRTFEVNDRVFLFCPTRKPGRCHTFRPFWQGPFIVVQKLSHLNYKIVDKKGKEFVVHVNRLKKSYDQTPWSFENTRRTRQESKQPGTETFCEDVKKQSRPIAISDEREPQIFGMQVVQEERPQLERDSPASGYSETPDADRDGRRQPPDSSVQDPDYEPSNSPRSRRELATTPIAPPITRSRARLQLQEDPTV